MHELVMDEAGRALLVGLVASGLLSALKTSSVGERIKGNKLALRGLCVAMVGAAAAGTDWVADGRLSLAQWWPVFWQGLLGAEFSYQWVLKLLERMRPWTPAADWLAPRA